MEETVLCTFCGKGITNKAKWELHIILHTGEKRYKCPQCKKRFWSRSAYQNHMRYHKGRKEFVCTYCGKAFMQRAHWQRHTATHTGERNHVRLVCQKAFIEPGDMRKHLRTHSKDATTFLIDSLASREGAKEGKEREEKPPPDQWPHHQLTPPQALAAVALLEHNPSKVGESQEGPNHRRRTPHRKNAVFLLLAPLAPRCKSKPPTRNRRLQASRPAAPREGHQEPLHAKNKRMPHLRKGMQRPPSILHLLR